MWRWCSLFIAHMLAFYFWRLIKVHKTYRIGWARTSDVPSNRAMFWKHSEHTLLHVKPVGLLISCLFKLNFRKKKNTFKLKRTIPWNTSQDPSTSMQTRTDWKQNMTEFRADIFRIIQSNKWSKPGALPERRLWRCIRKTGCATFIVRLMQKKKKKISMLIGY